MYDRCILSSYTNSYVYLLFLVIVPSDSGKRISKSQPAGQSPGGPRQRVSTATEHPVITVNMNESAKKTSKVQQPDDRMIKQLQEKAELPNETQVDYRY